MILLCLMYFTMPYTLYFNLTWLPTYLKEVRGFTVQEAAYLSSAVLFAGAIANWIGGRLTDSLTRRYGVRIGRSLGAVTLPLSGIVLVAAALVENRLAAAALFALTLGIADLCVSACWAMCHDIGGPRAGTIGGAMNTVGNIGGAHQPARRRLYRAVVGLLDAAVLHHRWRIRRGRDLHAAGGSAQVVWPARGTAHSATRGSAATTHRCTSHLPLWLQPQPPWASGFRKAVPAGKLWNPPSLAEPGAPTSI